MNSSGIKRGLAATAISALAVTGLPALASTASAEAGDEIIFVSAGPTLNHGNVGGEIHVKLKGITEAELDFDLEAFNSGLTGGPNSASQTVTIKDKSYSYIADGAAGDSNKTDGYAEAIILVAVDTQADGDTANYALVVNDAGTGVGGVDATDARTQVSQQTSGALKTIEVAPTSQSAAQNQESGDYIVTLKDAAGRTTQLKSGETVAVTPAATVTVSDMVLDASQLQDGSEAFTAHGPTEGSYDIAIDSPTYSDEETKATLVVVTAAVITAPEVDIVTGADSWDGFGDGTDGGTTAVRVDQNTIRIDFKTDDPGSTVTMTASSGNVTFGGKASTTVSTVLDSNGLGSITITADAGTVQQGDSITLSGNTFDQTFNFERAAVTASSLDAPAVVYTQVDTPTSVTVAVTDQFGNPVQGAQVSASVAGNGIAPNTQPRQTTDASGHTTFNFPAGDTQVGDQDTVTYTLYDDAADASGTAATDQTVIKYTADGMGPNYQIKLDNVDTEGATYSPDKVTVIPLADADADTDSGPKGDEVAKLTIANGAGGTPVTVSVDGGALILTGSKTSLADGKSSVAGVVGDTFKIVGTTSGIVTVTTTTGGRTETAQLTVEAQDDYSTARNVTVSGPASVAHGTSDFTDTVVVTDAFGNPVQGVSIWDLNIQVSGPGSFKDGDTMTDANGQLSVNIAVQPDAAGDITVTVTGVRETRGDYNQFGAAADQVYPNDAAGSGKGLSASSNVGTATTTVLAAEEPPPPVVDPVNPSLVVRGRNNGARNDKVVARAINLTEGATVRLFKKTKKGLRLLQTATMNSKGNHKFVGINDKNGRKYTKYVVKVERTDATNPGRGAKRLR